MTRWQKGPAFLTGKADTTRCAPRCLMGYPQHADMAGGSFGPVKAIIRVHGEQEAPTVANESEYGLSSAVYSRDTARAWNA
jgi:benzaldehyde dehydrogenase (NAD)